MVNLSTLFSKITKVLIAVYALPSIQSEYRYSLTRAISNPHWITDAVSIRCRREVIAECLPMDLGIYTFPLRHKRYADIPCYRTDAHPFHL